MPLPSNAATRTSAASFRHPDALDPVHFTDWVIRRFDDLVSEGAGPPLVVPLTCTFAPLSMRPDAVLVQFERFYARLCRSLMNNHERPSKRHLLPLVIAWRDDPRTRPDKYRARPSHVRSEPSFAPHVHAIMVIHPALVARFRDIAGTLEDTWREIPTFSTGVDAAHLRRLNRTFRIERDLGERVSRGLLSNDRDVARAELGRWVAYSAKLARRRDAGDADLFTVLPTATNAPTGHRAMAADSTYAIAAVT